jgi:DNA-binding transcriptional regulator YiaG
MGRTDPRCASEPAFARILNVSPRTVQARETDVRRPSDAALKLLSVAKTHPEVLLGVAD